MKTRRFIALGILLGMSLFQILCFSTEAAAQSKSMENEMPVSGESGEFSNWDPIQEMEAMQQKIDKMFRENFRKAAKEEKTFLRKATFEPAMTVKETKTNYMISMDLPGMNKEDINIGLKDHSLTISGERKTDVKKENEKIIEEEKSFGYFFRMITLPEDVKANEMSAEYKNGVLRITMPRIEAAKKGREADMKITVR